MVRRIVMVTLLLVACLLSAVAWAVTPAALKADIESRYRLTSLDALGFLKESGATLVVRKEGLRVDRPGAFNRATVIRSGEVVEPGGSGVPLGAALDNGLKVGDQLRLHGVVVDDSSVELKLFTVKSFVVTGSRGAIPLQAIVRFRYAGGLAAVSGRQVLGDLDTWFGSENALRVAKAVRQGQTPEEVAAILGEPEKKILLGAKAVFIYSDMKLLFMDGKLVDME